MVKAANNTGTKQRSFMFVVSGKKGASQNSPKSSLGSGYRSADYNKTREKLARSLPNSHK